MRELTLAIAARVAVRLGRLRRDERGAIGIIVAVLLGAGVLTGAGALVVDVGQLYQERAELQNGADAAALGVAKTCVLGACDPSAAQHYADANASSLTGHSAGVSLVCGSAPGLAACPSGSTADCPPPSTANYVEAFTATLTSSGSHLLPPVFARTLIGNSGYQGTQVQACSQATWGYPTTGTTAGLAISACEWDQATQQGTMFAPAPPYPPDPLPDPALDRVLTPDPGNGAGCGLEPGGADGPGTFGWLESRGGGCTAAVSPPAMAGGNQALESSSCLQAVQDAQQTYTPLLVPIYVSASGSRPTFTLKGFAEFVVTGYNLPDPDGDGTSRSAGDWLVPANSCQGSTYCITGYFVRGVVGSSAGLNGTNLGVSVLELTG